MLDIRFHNWEELDIIFNNSKSVFFKISPSYDWFIKNLKLGEADIVWTSKIKYLAVHFSRVKIYVDLSSRMRKYYAADNSILSYTKNVSAVVAFEEIPGCSFRETKQICFDALTEVPGRYIVTLKCTRTA